MTNVFSVGEMIKCVGISYRQAQYWRRTSFVAPSVRLGGRVSGYTFADVVLAKVAYRLRQANRSVQQMRDFIPALGEGLKRILFPLAQAIIVIDGDKFYIAKYGIVYSQNSDVIEINCADILSSLIPRHQIPV